MITRTERKQQYDLIHATAMLEGPEVVMESCRQLCLNDLFYLLTNVCFRKDLDKDWLFERCLEVQVEPDGMLDLWAREHYKSTIITFGKTIQDILWNPEITVGIFSHTKPIAKAFLRQIKYEFENNERLKELFPDILYSNPKKEAGNWSEDKGITVKRNSNPKEATVEAHGLVDGQPTSKHFSLLIYDDVVTRESVTSPEMIKKTTEAWELSLNLGANGGKKRHIGTRYHFNDTYASIMAKGSAKKRIYPATLDGTSNGHPVLLSQDALAEKRRDQGSYTFSCQMLQNPVADEAQGFKRDWLSFWPAREIKGLNIYILVDPANAKRKMNDYTSFFVVGLGKDSNYYVIDIVRDRLNLTERTKKLMELHEKYSFYGVSGVGYEQYGMQADIQHIQYVQEHENYRFTITELGGQMPKNDRIRRLIPIFENKRIFFPSSITKITGEGKAEDFVSSFVNDEYMCFPVSSHDDMLDCLARILDPDLNAKFPKKDNQQKKETWRDRLNKHVGSGAGATSPMAA